MHKYEQAVSEKKCDVTVIIAFTKTQAKGYKPIHNQTKINNT